jgi:small subunit ribosomal protein S19e
MEIKVSKVYEMPANEYNIKLAEELKKIKDIQMPEWAYYVKTGSDKLRPPFEDDWWHRRLASILRQIYLNKVVGVGRLRVKYGGRKNRGMKPETFAKASGKIIRVMLQQAEKSGLLKKVLDGNRFGRFLTENGKKFLEDVK